ncbi:Hsp20/alpha crystallin family protein [Pedococcus ginsenosidimutans]|uniref:Hsp20/alpha crystallin family protein n=1 Tax=Pedococcus ginsenosidimutans TaxID=490570 RepID=UPI0031EECEB3
MSSTTSPSTELRRRTPGRDVDPWTGFAPWGPRFQELIEQMWPSAEGTSDFSPGGQISETDDAFTLELDLPGVDKKDIEIDISGRRVSVTGTKVVKEREGVLRRSTRASGSFAYEAVLPVAVDASRTTASLADGVLVVSMPKVAESKATRVEIH